MTHKETVDAVRRSLLADESRESHHGVYAKRPPIVEPPQVEPPFKVDIGAEDPDFPGCYW